ncbi:acyl-CoA dehydrogenase family protein [Desertibaculum subflavum]|uniref:acyl-CoA dehydrogenase family protein n=1 Tax=Desertibaculum subflavum TaxID=2268458 RepID=UPI000E665D24
MTSGHAGEDFESYLARIRAFTADVLKPNEPRLEAEGRIPPEIVDEIRRIGLFGISLPPAYDGLGFSMVQQVRLTIEFTQASNVYRSRFSTTIGLCSQAILDHGTEEQKRKYLPRMARGDCTGAFALTEPEAGSDAGSARATAVRHGGDYVLNGTKRYITNAPDADVFVVMARTDQSKPGAGGMSAFLVDGGTLGIRIGEIPRMLGQTGSTSTEVYFEDCRVPASCLLGGVEGKGLHAALRGINHARTHVAATCVGQAIRLIEETTARALERHQFGKPIGAFQAVRAKLAESKAEMLAARALTLDVAQRFDSGQIPAPDISAAKWFASEMVSRVADRCVQVHGGMGFMENNAVTRLYRDTRLFRLFEGTSEIQLDTIARDMLGGLRSVG